MESSWTDRYIKVYTLAVVDEACMDASMSATEQTYAHCQTVIDEKDATINALQVERKQFKVWWHEQSILKAEFELSLIKLQTKYKALRAKHKALRAKHKALQARLQDFLELHKDSCVFLQGGESDSD